MTHAMDIALDELRRWTADVFTSIGVPADTTEAVVDNLAFAEARGVRSHGFIRVPIYVERIIGGGIDAQARPSISRDEGALVILDAAHGPGAATGVVATNLVIERAKSYGIGCALVRDANHFGAAAYYTESMADAGCFGIAACNTDKAMCAPFGGSPVLGTNPLSIAVPVPAARRPQLDMATSEVSLGKVLLAAQAHRDIPLGWAVDTAGAPTTSAHAALAGALLPSGGPKGFGLAFMIDALVALAGATTSPRAGEMYGERSQSQELGLAFIAIRGDAGVEPSTYERAIDDLVNDVHASGPGPTGVPALVPGEPELAQAGAFDGTVSVDGELRDELSRIGVTTGVPLP